MRSPETTSWHSASWQAKPAQQQPVYPDPARARARRGADLAPAADRGVLGDRGAARAARRGAARRGVPAAGRRLRRDASPTASPTPITKKLKILLQMSLVLVHGAQEAGRPRRPLRRAVRQAALGRHRDARRRDAAELPRRPRQPARVHAPTRAPPIRSCCCAATSAPALTLNFVRALVDGGFADLHHPEYWDLGFVQHSPLEGRSTSASSTSIARRAATSSRRISGRAGARGDAASTSTPATRGCTCSTSRRRRASCRARTAGTTSRRTCRGSACAPRSSTARTSSTSAASPTRSASRSARRWTRRLAAGPGRRRSTRRTSPGRLTLHPSLRRQGRRRQRCRR